MKKTILLLAALCLAGWSLQHTVLQGTITDDQGEPLVAATVKLMNGQVLVRQTHTDIDGHYRFEVEPGTYDLEVLYTGFPTSRKNGIQILAGQFNECNAVLSNTELSEIVISACKVPLIEPDKTSGGLTLTSEQIKSLPTRNVNALVPATGISTPIDGGAVNIKGSRSNATNYYIGDARFAGTPPQVKGIESLQNKPSKSPQALPGAATEQDINPYRGNVFPTQKLDPQTGAVTKDELGRVRPDTIEPIINEQYNVIVENPFQDTRQSAISTFSIDVDAASYASIRRYLSAGQLPPADAVRLEEMVNYFDYQYDAPGGRHPFEVSTDLAPCPWQPQHRLLRIGLQGKTMDTGQLPPSNLVFLLDVSGSMEEPAKLPLVKQSLGLLVDQLRPIDRVAIVVYAGAAGLVLPSTAGADKRRIKAALEALEAGGSTAGGAGIQLAYRIARENLLAKGNNRVILCTDGDFNVGTSSESELVKLIENERQSGIYLSVLGFGTGNYQDGKMQSLADKGNGNHAYIDGLKEAKKVLISEFGGTLFTIAKDVKLQLHFNPAQVAGYRLLGYENRLLATEDFNDDTKDAGEMGAGHRVTALYEIVPAGQSLPALSILDSALVMAVQPDTSVSVRADDLFVLQLRYKQPQGEAPSQLLEYRLNAAALDRTEESENFLLASAVAEFGLLLRDSKFKGNASYPDALARARAAAVHDPAGLRTELVRMMEQAERLANGGGAAKK